MKKCPYCGKEYPDDVARCLIDDELLSGGEQPSPPPLAISEVDTATPPPASETAATPPSTLVLTEWQMCLIEVVLVCTIAFGSGVFSSMHSLYYHGTVGSGSDSGNYRWFYASVRQASCLGLLWYVLRRNGRTFFDLGFSWSRQDIGPSILLKLFGTMAFYAVYYSIHFIERMQTGNQPSSINVGFYLFGNSVAGLAMLFQFLNPFFEELIVRAYVMTEVRRLTNSMGKAIFVSTALQASYHFYQGTPAALAHGATFLIFSIYYAKTNRITPIILAHLYSDVGFTLVYIFHH